MSIGDVYKSRKVTLNLTGEELLFLKAVLADKYAQNHGGIHCAEMMFDDPNVVMYTIAVNKAQMNNCEKILKELGVDVDDLNRRFKEE